MLIREEVVTMNILNRVLVIVYLVALIAAVALALVQPDAAIRVLRGAVDGLDAFSRTYYYAYEGAGIALIVLALALLVLELRRPRRRTVRVRQASGGMVELTTESVARGLEYHIAQLAGVRQVRPQVSSSGKAVGVALDLELDPAVDVPSKSEEVLQLAREIVELRLGLRLGRIAANVRQGAYSKDVAPARPSVGPLSDVSSRIEPPESESDRASSGTLP
ncbi:MAG: hypothetical protein K6V36_07615 [Anaerolineae bacterium]|nr:hypothetical protein [Anaerolineae bacterium]